MLKISKISKAGVPSAIAAFFVVSNVGLIAYIIRQHQRTSENSRSSLTQKSTTYTINVLTGIATQTCFLLCFNNSDEDMAKTKPKCFAEDSSMMDRDKFRYYLERKGSKVRVVSQSPEQKTVLTNVRMGRLSDYEACHYQPTVIEVKGEDRCDAPFSPDKSGEECEELNSEVTVLNKVEDVEFIPSKSEKFLDIPERLRVLLGKLFNATGINRYQEEICIKASNSYLYKRIQSDRRVSRAEAIEDASSSGFARNYISKDRIGLLAASGFARVKQSEQLQSHIYLDQYKKGIFIDEVIKGGKGSIARGVQRVRCSYGGYNPKLQNQIFQKITYYRRDKPKVDRLAGTKLLNWNYLKGNLE